MKIKLLLSIFITFAINVASTSAMNIEKKTIDTRTYCKTSGGNVNETGYQHIHICCYPDKQKCLVANGMNGYSLLIPLKTPSGKKKITTFVPDMY